MNMAVSEESPYARVPEMGMAGNRLAVCASCPCRSCRGGNRPRWVSGVRLVQFQKILSIHLWSRLVSGISPTSRLRGDGSRFRPKWLVSVQASGLVSLRPRPLWLRGWSM